MYGMAGLEKDKLKVGEIESPKGHTN